MKDPPVDFQVLANLAVLQRMGSPGIVKRIIGMYLKNSLKIVEALFEALATENILQLQHSAHNLKSNSASVGANSLAALCNELETMARENNIRTAGELVDRIKVEYERARSVLEEEYERSADG